MAAKPIQVVDLFAGPGGLGEVTCASFTFLNYPSHRYNQPQARHL